MSDEWHKDPKQCKVKQLYCIFLGKQAEVPSQHKHTSCRMPVPQDMRIIQKLQGPLLGTLRAPSTDTAKPNVPSISREQLPFPGHR